MKRLKVAASILILWGLGIQAIAQSTTVEIDNTHELNLILPQNTDFLGANLSTEEISAAEKAGEKR